MLWYVLGAVLSIVVYFGGKAIAMSAVLKWIAIGLIWAGAVHMKMRGEEKQKSSQVSHSDE